VTPTLTLIEAAALAGCHPDTMRRMMKSREAPGTKVGRRWICTAEVFADYLKAPRNYMTNARRQQLRRLDPTYAARNLEYVTRHRARKLRRLPSWASVDAIAQVYAEARRLTLATGRRHEVDHIVPLLGRNVSGLHVACNLRIVDMDTNRRKGNRWDP
jgi:excisionase family DNA binding protein